MAVTAVKNPFETVFDNKLLALQNEQKSIADARKNTPVTTPVYANPQYTTPVASPEYMKAMEANNQAITNTYNTIKSYNKFATNTGFSNPTLTPIPEATIPTKSIWDTSTSNAPISGGGGGGGGSTNTYNNTITGFDTFQPDASAANPTTKQELRNWAGATDTAVRSTGGDTGFVNNYFNAWNADQSTPASTTPQQTTTAPASTSAIPESQKPPATTVGANYNNNVSGFNIGVNNPNAISGFNNYTPPAMTSGVDPYTSYIMGPNVDPATVWNEFSSKFNTKDPQSIKSGLAWIGQVGGPEKLNATMNYLKTISKAGDPNSPYNLANKDDLSKFTFDSPHYQAGLKFAQASLNKLGITDLQIKDSTSLADAYSKRVAQAGGKLDPNELKHWKSAAFLFGIDDSKLPPELQSSAFGMGTGAPDDPYTLAGQVFAASYGFPQVKDINTLAAEFDKRPKPLSQEEAQLWKEAAMMFGFDGSGFDFINGRPGSSKTTTSPGTTYSSLRNGVALPPGITPSNLSVSKFLNPDDIKPYQNNYNAPSLSQVMNNMQGPSDTQFNLFKSYVGNGDYTNAAKLARGFGFTDRDIADYVRSYMGDGAALKAAQYLYENPDDKYKDIAKTKFDRVDTNAMPQVVSQGIDINGMPKVIYSDGTAVTGTVSNDSLVKNQMSGLLGENSKYLQLARNNALQQANARGLLNSSIAAGAGENAAIQNALPIAQQDAGTYAKMDLTNLDNQNQMARLNANNQLDASKSNANNWLSASTTNANNALDASKSNAGNWLNASTTNANNSLSAGTNDANAVNTINRDRFQNQLAMGLQTQGKAQDLYNSSTLSNQDYINKGTLQDKAHLNDMEMVGANMEAQTGLMGYQADLAEKAKVNEQVRVLERDKALSDLEIDRMFKQSGITLSEKEKDNFYNIAMYDRQLAGELSKIDLQGRIQAQDTDKKIAAEIETAKINASAKGASGGDSSASVQWEIAQMRDRSDWQRFWVQRDISKSDQDEKARNDADDFLNKLDNDNNGRVASAVQQFTVNKDVPKEEQINTVNEIKANGATTYNSAAYSFYKKFGLPDMRPPNYQYTQPPLEVKGGERIVQQVKYLPGSFLGIPGTEEDRYQYPVLANASPEEQRNQIQQQLGYNPSDIAYVFSQKNVPSSNSSSTAKALG